MTYRGHVKNGLIVLESPADIPEGTPVEVRPLSDAGEIGTLAERYKDIIGIAEGLPPDSSRKHDQYLYGTSER